jgi:hypothetical protein
VRRHPLDLFSLLAGLLFFALGLLYVIGEYTTVHVDARLVLPLLLIWLGVSGLVGALVAQNRSDRRVLAAAAPVASEPNSLDEVSDAEDV